ncbi:glycosyltransferase family 2 protein [Pontibacter sp. JH31]|uniref:Glycosyltransferase family 2 protein n=1 Tax=Pontibacter aquaedesilientis TaxID=2766980 RepID=A0ABR7XF78_9BACT|nr:glycosyltransferase family 2 protein [Pontibacter aquaedesilientis]MBD1396953.1 glycosyltransferase family 2 protein [Pontibacter aquaedesilientis]
MIESFAKKDGAMPLVSIVVPTYNRGDIISTTIESIIKQTYICWELLIVDDGSTDDTEDIVKSFAAVDIRIKYYARPNNRKKGANSCRNYGYEHAKGKFIKWVDSDDILIPEALFKQIQLISIDPEYKVCFAYGRFFNDETSELEEGWARKYTSENLLWDYIRNIIRWPVGGPLWEMSFFESSPFNEKLKNSQEWLMHGEQVIKLKTNNYVILSEDIYLIRRGNVRMSSSRSSGYYYNSAKARTSLLLSHLKSKAVSSSIIIELTKQILVFSYHTTKSAVLTITK